MPTSADCQNTKTTDGNNPTPVAILQAARDVLDYIELDPASSAMANEFVGARRFYDISQDGYNQHWEANTVWLNPPGKTRSQGKQISASHWFRRLHSEWASGNVGHAIAMVYRAGSIGSCGIDLLGASTICLTAAGATHPVVNGSGRLSFLANEDGKLVEQTQNTQSSVIMLLSDDALFKKRFREVFSQFGVVK